MHGEKSGQQERDGNRGNTDDLNKHGHGDKADQRGDERGARGLTGAKLGQLELTLSHSGTAGNWGRGNGCRIGLNNRRSGRQDVSLRFSATMTEESTFD